MEYHIRIDEDVKPAVRRIALKQIEVGIQEIENAALDRHEVVHQIRKRCKKQRALLRLVRPCIGSSFHAENVFYRDLSRNLSSLRDAQALLESFDRTVAHFQDQVDPAECTTIREHLLELRDAEASHEDQLVAALEKSADEFETGGRANRRMDLGRDRLCGFRGGLGSHLSTRTTCSARSRGQSDDGELARMAKTGEVPLVPLTLAATHDPAFDSTASHDGRRAGQLARTGPRPGNAQRAGRPLCEGERFGRLNQLLFHADHNAPSANSRGGFGARPISLCRNAQATCRSLAKLLDGVAQRM